MNSTTTPGSGRVRGWLWGAAAAAALVTGGAGALLIAPPQPPPAPSASEAALSRAEDDAERLAALAGGLLLGAATPTPADAPRATVLSEPARAVVARSADILRLQAGVLTARGGTEETGTDQTPPSPTAEAEAGASPHRPSQEGTAIDLVRGLGASARARWADLPSVDGPTASVLASLATAQTLQSAALEAVVGTPSSDAPAPSGSASPSPAPPASAPPASASPASASPAPSPTPTPSAPVCAPALGSPAPEPTATGPNTSAGVTPAQALQAVRAAEAAAEWSYTVLAARSEGAEREAALAAARGHGEQVARLEGLASTACTVLPPPAPGYALGPDAGTPASLLALEDSAAAAWATAVGSLAADHRAAAAEGLRLASARRAAAGPADAAWAAFPGLDEAIGAAKELSAPSTRPT